ncbi:MAG TPA: hypothetical protein VF177_05500 [Anaerolineae bacterium]
MIPIHSIKSHYTLALAEGEGVGTAYEYYAKRLVLSPWLRQVKRPERVLVAGLPQKYGVSLDFLLLAAELGAAVVVIDERPQAIARLQRALAAAQAQGWLVQLDLVCRVVASLADVTEEFDLCLSSEVLPRLAAGTRTTYVRRLQNLTPAVALFAPNADNPLHTTLSGLSGLHRSELEALVGGRGAGEPGSRVGVTLSGYLDMPPFPPGVVRDENQRARASSGRFEALAMWALGYYARLEKYVPTTIRRRHSHIVYAFTRRA